MANFKYVEKVTASKQILNLLRDEVTDFTEYPFESSVGETAETNTWIKFHEVADTDGNIKELILQGTVSIGDPAVTKDTYLRFVNHALTTRTYPPNVPTHVEHSSMSVQILDEPDDPTATDPSTIVWGKEGYPVLFQWADEAFTPTDRDETKPVYLFLNVMNNRLAMVCVADPAVNFKDYRKSFLYAGALKPFKYNEFDVTGNIMVTAGAVVDEETMTNIATNATYYFGEYTSAGNNTFQMLKTHSGIEYQRHYPAFITQAPPVGKSYSDSSLGDTGLELEPQGFQASRWTNKYHLSPIYVVHPYEGYRGQLDNCIGITKHNILHLDELVIDVENKAWNQEVYKYFDIDTEQNFMNLSPNQEMGVAVLKEVRYPTTAT